MFNWEKITQKRKESKYLQVVQVEERTTVVMTGTDMMRKRAAFS